MSGARRLRSTLAEAPVLFARAFVTASKSKYFQRPYNMSATVVVHAAGEAEGGKGKKGKGKKKK